MEEMLHFEGDRLTLIKATFSNLPCILCLFFLSWEHGEEIGGKQGKFL